MNELIEEFYNGRLIPIDQIISTDPEYKPTHKQINVELKYLISKLPEEAAPHLDELEKLYLLSTEMTCYAGFSYGFKLGIQLMHEAFTEDKKASLDKN